MWGKRDMTFGYIFFAGSGANSRGAQMVLALCPDIDACRQTGLGKALWETPVGSVRKEDFPVLEKIMSSGKPYPRLEMLGQHPDAGGPNQGKLVSDPEYLQHEYPFMEYWRGCRVQHRGVRYARPRSVDLGSRPAVALASSSQENTDRRVATQLKPLEGADADDNRPFRVEFIVSTSTEEAVENDRIVFEITPTWAPLGAKRFKELVSAGYFDGARFFRAIKHFMAQFGIAKDPATTKLWQSKRFLDDARIESNKRGTISFATSGPNSRSTQLFINFVDNSFLDSEGFSPIGRIVEGLSVLDKINTEYGEGGRGDGSDGKGPSQGRANNEGNAYLQKFFPRLSYIVTARVIT
jgi:peptidyl-prolyl cis-trans isomerase A (cyclophilin A)